MAVDCHRLAVARERDLHTALNVLDIATAVATLRRRHGAASCSTSATYSTSATCSLRLARSRPSSRSASRVLRRQRARRKARAAAAGSRSTTRSSRHGPTGLGAVVFRATPPISASSGAGQAAPQAMAITPVSRSGSGARVWCARAAHAPVAASPRATRAGSCAMRATATSRPRPSVCALGKGALAAREGQLAARKGCARGARVLDAVDAAARRSAARARQPPEGAAANQAAAWSTAACGKVEMQGASYQSDYLDSLYFVFRLPGGAQRRPVTVTRGSSSAAHGWRRWP